MSKPVRHSSNSTPGWVRSKKSVIYAQSAVASDAETTDVGDDYDTEGSSTDTEHRRIASQHCHRSRCKAAPKESEILSFSSYPVVAVCRSLFQDFLGFLGSLVVYIQRFLEWEFVNANLFLYLLLTLSAICTLEILGHAGYISQTTNNYLTSLPKFELHTSLRRYYFPLTGVPPVEFDELANIQSSFVDTLDNDRPLLAFTLDKKLHPIERTFKFVRGSDLEPHDWIYATIDAYSTTANGVVNSINLFNRKVWEEVTQIIIAMAHNEATFRQVSSSKDDPWQAVTNTIPLVLQGLQEDKITRMALFQQYLHDLDMTKSAVNNMESDIEDINHSVQQLDGLFDRMYQWVISNEKYHEVGKEDPLGRLLKDMEPPKYRKNRAHKIESDIVELRTLPDLHNNLIDYVAGVDMGLKAMSSDLGNLQFRAHTYNRTASPYDEQNKVTKVAIEKLSEGLERASMRTKDIIKAASNFSRPRSL